MGDDNTGDATCVNGFDDLILSPGVQGTGGLVHNADCGILRKGAGDFEPLALSAGEVPAAVQQLVEEAALTGDDIVVDAGVPGSEGDLEVLNGIVPHLDILADSVLKEGNILVDDADRAGEHIPVDILQRHAVEGNGAAPGTVEAGDQLGQGGFAAAGAPHEGDLLAGLYRHGEVRDLGLAQAGVAEGDVLQFNGAGELLVFGGLFPGLEGGILRIAHDVVHALHLGGHLLHALPGGDQLRRGSHEGGQEALEGHDHTGGKLALDDQQHAEAQHRDVRSCGDGGRQGTQEEVQPGVGNRLGIDAGLVAGPAAEKAVLGAAGLDGLNHGDTGHGGGGELRRVALLHAGDVHTLRRDQGGNDQVQDDGSHADGGQHRAVMDHDHQVEDHHRGLDGQGCEGLYQGGGNARVGGLAVSDVTAQPLGEKLHGQAQHLPEVGGAAIGSHLALDLEGVDRGDPGDDDTDQCEEQEQQDEGRQPFRVGAGKQPVQEGPGEGRLDDAQQGCDGGGQDHEGHCRAGPLQALFCVGQDGFGFAGGGKAFAGLKAQADTGEFPVELFPFHLYPAPGRVVDDCAIPLEAAEHNKVVETPVDDAGEGAFLLQVLGLHAPGIGGQAVTAGSNQDVLCAGAVHGNAAVHTGLLQRNPVFIVMHNHGQRGRAAFQRLHLHDHGHLRHTLDDGRRYLLFQAEHLAASLLQKQGDRPQVLLDGRTGINAVLQVRISRNQHNGIADRETAGPEHTQARAFGYDKHFIFTGGVQRVFLSVQYKPALGQDAVHLVIGDIADCLSAFHGDRHLGGSPDMAEDTPQDGAHQQADDSGKHQPHPGRGDSEIIVQALRGFHGFQAFFTEQFDLCLFRHSFQPLSTCSCTYMKSIPNIIHIHKKEISERDKRQGTGTKGKISAGIFRFSWCFSYCGMFIL